MDNMPEGVFAVRCPNPQCQKYMLVEEQKQTDVVNCLLCKTKIKLASVSANKEVEK